MVHLFVPLRESRHPFYLTRISMRLYKIWLHAATSICGVLHKMHHKKLIHGHNDNLWVPLKGVIYYYLTIIFFLYYFKSGILTHVCIVYLYTGMMNTMVEAKYTRKWILFFCYLMTTMMWTRWQIVNYLLSFGLKTLSMSLPAFVCVCRIDGIAVSLYTQIPSRERKKNRREYIKWFIDSVQLTKNCVW